MEVAVVILAAGEGTRMKSDLPKVLHTLGGRPMLEYSLETARAVTDAPPILIVGHGAELVTEAAGEDVVSITQSPPLGTGHAVLQARDFLEDRAELVLVSYADMPLLTGETLGRLVDGQRECRGPMTLLTLMRDESRGFGRVIRDQDGSVIEIVEEAVAAPQELAVRELNAGVYCFDAGWLWDHVEEIPLSLPREEYYLTDLVEMAAAEGREVQAVVIENEDETLGINTRVHLAEAEGVLRGRINEHWMNAGVTLIDPAATYIGPGVTIGRDTVIQPGTHLRGATTIGERCTIGPDAIVEDCSIADECVVIKSVLEHAVMERGSDLGPFGHLRRGARLCEGAHVGNFGELKNATLGPGAKVGHFSYLGDAQVGAGANVGAGTVTCNYDGERKHATVIEEGAFVGSDTMLVAPVRVGRGARTGAGAVVTRDVPDGALVYGVPARIHGEVEGEEDDERQS